jgi:hypothetical protein
VVYSEKSCKSCQRNQELVYDATKRHIKHVKIEGEKSGGISKLYQWGICRKPIG